MALRTRVDYGALMVKTVALLIGLTLGRGCLHGARWIDDHVHIEVSP